MPPVYNKIQIRGYRVLRYEQKGERLYVDVELTAKRAPKCTLCNHDKVWSKGVRIRKARHLSVFGKDSILSIRHRRYQCVRCKGSFNPPMPGLMPGKQSTEPFREHVAKLHHEGIPGRIMAKIAKIGSATVERFYTHYNRRKAAERSSLQAPIVLGIDEHTLHKKQRFATTFCDLKNHKVFDIVPGKSAKDLEGYLSKLQGRDKVKMVCIDLSHSYRALVKKWFPNARIVADRFHVVRIILHHFITLCREIMGDYASKNKASVLLRTNPENLTARGKLRLEALFIGFPALKPIYDEIRSLHTLVSKKSQNKRQCRRLTKQLLRAIERLERSCFSALITLAATLRSWIEPIVCMWRSTKNNGITEGFHRKMKLLQRRAYGFKNFENYRLRVLAHCG